MLAACMNTNNDGKESQTNEKNNTNNEQTKENNNQDKPGNRGDYDRNQDNKDRNKQGEYGRNKNGNHNRDHHERREWTPNDSEYNQEEIVLENGAFQIFEPFPKSNVKNKIIVRGLARVFEGTIQYEFEDNHSTLDEGYTTASRGAPEWGEFEITIEIDKSAHRSARIKLYEESAKDGSKINELIIPVHVNQ